MRALAVASAIRAPQLPDVPLLSEQGVQGGEADAWIGLWAPAGTPPAVLARLSQAVTAALARPELREAATKLGIAVNLRDAEELRPLRRGRDQEMGRGREGGEREDRGVSRPARPHCVAVIPDARSAIRDLDGARLRKGPG